MVLGTKTVLFEWNTKDFLTTGERVFDASSELNQCHMKRNHFSWAANTWNVGTLIQKSAVCAGHRYPVYGVISLAQELLINQTAEGKIGDSRHPARADEGPTCPALQSRFLPPQV